MSEDKAQLMAAKITMNGLLAELTQKEQRKVKAIVKDLKLKCSELGVLGYAAMTLAMAEYGLELLEGNGDS